MRVAIVGVIAIGLAVAALIVGNPHRKSAPGIGAASPITRAASPAARPLSSTDPAMPPVDPRAFAGELDRAQLTIDNASSSFADLESAGGLQQLATAALARAPRAVQRAILGRLAPATASTMRANLVAAGTLSRLVVPRVSFPHWRIVSPPPPPTLLRYFRAAQSQFGIGWEYLAAIEFVETKFGRVHGLSPAGAQGPMQFMPATWKVYGHGDVHNPRDAIFGAARYLVASGARGDIAGALYHYNPSADYVIAVESYARRMRADPRAYYGYYYWQVIYAKRTGSVILPVGYPKVRPVPLHVRIRGRG
jgi:soluble lytic murein transglycosylase-like protein